MSKSKPMSPSPGQSLSARQKLLANRFYRRIGELEQNPVDFLGRILKEYKSKRRVLMISKITFHPRNETYIIDFLESLGYKYTRTDRLKEGLFFVFVNPKFPIKQ